MSYCLKILALLFGLLNGCLQALDTKIVAKEAEKKSIEKNNQRRREEYQADKKKSSLKYFEEQEIFFKLLSSIPGVRRLTIEDASFAEKLFTDCPEDVKGFIFKIEDSLKSKNKIQEKVILCGEPSVGKTSLAQAIAIKTRVPCLFFNAQHVSNNENMKAIFEHIKNLEKTFNKPFILIFDNLHALVRDNINNVNKYLEFQDNLNSLMRDGVIVIGTMDLADDLPKQITEKISIIQIQIPLPDEQQRKKTLLDIFKRNRINPENDSILDNLAEKMYGYSYSKLNFEVGKIAYSLSNKPETDTGYKVFTNEEYSQFAKNIKKEFKRKSFNFKNITFSHIQGVSVIALGFSALGFQWFNSNKLFDQGERKMKQDDQNAKKGYDQNERRMQQDKENSDRQYEQGERRIQQDKENSEKGRELSQKGYDQAKAEADYNKSFSGKINRLVDSAISGVGSEAGKIVVVAGKGCFDKK